MRCRETIAVQAFHFFPILVSHVSVFTSWKYAYFLILCSLAGIPRTTSAAETDVPSKEVLFLQYGQIASQVRNSAIQFVTREVSKGSPHGDEEVLIKCCQLFTFGDEAQFRATWSNSDQPDWRSMCKFEQIGGSPNFGTEGVDRVICFRSEDRATAEFVNIQAKKKAPYSILMTQYESERTFGPFFLPYVAAGRQWNYRDEFTAAGLSLVDEFFRHGVEKWSDPIRAVLDGEERWRVDISLSGQRVPLSVRPDYGKLEGEDVLSSWFESQSPYRLRAVTRERRYFHEGVEVPIEFIGQRWWERRVDLSDYDRSPGGFTFPMEGRETLVLALHGIETFDDVATAYVNKGVLTLNSEHYIPLDRSWSVKKIERLESGKGIWIEPGPGMMIHKVDTGTEVIFGKTKEESAAILGYDLSATPSTPPPIPTADPGLFKIALVVANIVVFCCILLWYLKKRQKH